MSKRFIDKTKAVTFQLVHRSQQDPLVADENAPQRVLLPVAGKETESEKEKRLEEQHKYGVYFDDDYNYLQHLKESRDGQMTWPENIEGELKKKVESTKLQLPSSVFASEVEEDVGMLNKAAPVSGPQLHLDPELVAAMDDDFDYSDPKNQLEDNFMELANGVASDEEKEDDKDYDDLFDSEGEERDEINSLPGSMRSFEEEETKSRFTSYSMTSSVIRRNEQLTLLDNRFEKMYEGYDDEELGALDCDEIEGHVPVNSDILLKLADEFEKQQAREHMDKDEFAAKIKQQMEEEDLDDEELVAMPVEEKEKWDCETILSTYSNIYNRPKLISEPKIKINKRTGIPMNILGEHKLTTKALNRFNEETPGFEQKGTKSVGGQSIISQLSTLSIRPKNESPQERRERKKLLKEYKRERRSEKKANKEAFKEEAARQVKIAFNNRNNVQGNKIL